jgi:methionine synthase I (cobalamin-dependent)
MAVQFLRLYSAIPECGRGVKHNNQFANVPESSSIALLHWHLIANGAKIYTTITFTVEVLPNQR